MKKYLSYILIIFIITIFYIIPGISSATTYYYEFRNPYATQTTVCGITDPLNCASKLKEICGANTSASCIQSTEDCPPQNWNTPLPEPICPQVQNITGQKTQTPSNGVYKLLAPIGKFMVAPDNIGEYFNLIFKLAIGLCAVLAVIMIVIGGVQYMGDESIFGKTEAKGRITKAILGLLIALGSYALLNTINPKLLGGDGINIAQVSAEIEGDTDAPVTLGSSGTIQPESTGIICNKTGGFSVLPTVVKSFKGKMTYEMGAKGKAGPGGTIKYDCSGFVNATLQCAGINKNSVNGGTWTIFSGAKAEKISSPVSITNTSINNVSLQVGDLVGWKAENGEPFGHVMIYIGGGLIADSHGGKEGRKQGGAYGQFSIEKYKDRIKYVVRTSKL